MRGEEQGDVVRNVVGLEELADIYHQREHVEDEDIEHILLTFAMNLMMLESACGGTPRP